MSKTKYEELNTELGGVLPIEFIYTTDSKGVERPTPCQENITRAVRSLNCVRYDTFKNKYEMKDGDAWEVRDDHHDIELHSIISNLHPFLVRQSISAVRDAITLVGHENSYDSAQEYVQGLTWDATPRLDQWLQNVYHLPDNEYHRKIGSNWLKGLVKRIMHPGSKFDYALLLQGPQGIKKSTSLLVLAGEENHVEFTDLKVREFQQDIQGKLVVEFSEGAVFTKSDQETLKSIVTRQQDTYRPPYARASKDFPRRCVFAVTANNDEILKDDTGNRRWWVVFLPDKDADLDWLVENRDQLFAEAYERAVNLEESVWEIPAEPLREQQDMARMREQNEDIYAMWYHKLSDQEKAGGVTSRMAYCAVLEPRDRNGDIIEENHVNLDKRTEMAITRIFKHLGLKKHRAGRGVNRETRWSESDTLDGMDVIIEKEDAYAEVIKHF